MKPKRRTSAAIPADLATFDVDRWHAAAATDPDPHGWQHCRPTDLYEQALLDAGVDEDQARRLGAAAVVAHLKRRLGWHDKDHP